MVVELKKQANKYLLIGFFVWFGGNILKGVYTQPDPFYYIGILLFLIGYCTFIYGCILYSKAKGHSWILGLLGLLNLIGLIILAVLPDKFKIEKK